MSHTHRGRPLVPVLAAALALVSPARGTAQQESQVRATASTVTLEGRVADQRGAPLGDVLVRLDGTPRGAVTDESGRFRIAGVPEVVSHILATWSAMTGKPHPPSA